MIIQTILLDPSGAFWTDWPSNLSRLDPSGAVQSITRAIRLIDAGARFIATNPDPTGPSPAGPQPATGAVAALISKATGVRPYFVGKPNPLMMREALRTIDAHSESTVMIGDRMDTDIVAGIEAGLQTVLVLSGITTREEAERFPFLPSRIVDSVADLVDDIGDEPRPAGWPPARRRLVPQPMSARRHQTGSHRSEPPSPPKRPRYYLLHRHEPSG
jgi:hypothetical protein